MRIIKSIIHLKKNRPVRSNADMFYIVLAFVLTCRTCTSTPVTSSTDLVTVNVRTGMMSRSSLPLIAQPGDEIILCAPFGHSTLCDRMHNGTCMVSDEMCHTRHMPSSLHHGSSCILNVHTPQYWRQTICPSSDPVPHCMAMWRHNKRNLYQCIRTLSNLTVCPNSSPSIDSVERRLLVHVSRPHERNENVIWTCLSLEVFLSVLIFSLCMLNGRLLEKRLA